MVENPFPIVWAVDLHENDPTSIQVALSFFKALGNEGAFVVEPVYVLRAGEQPQEMASRAASFQSISLAGLKPPTLLKQTGVYLHSDTATLAHHAKRVGAVFVVAFTHSNSVARRLWLGSFAQSLMTVAEVPVLLINPAYRLPLPVAEVVFATSLEESEKAGLEKVAQFARLLNASLVLFSKVESFTLSPGLSLTKTTLYSEKVKEEALSRQKTLEQWAEIPRSLGVRTTVEVGVNRRKTVEAILERSQRGATILALAPHSMRIRQFLTGDITRRVLHQAHSPIQALAS